MKLILITGHAGEGKTTLSNKLSSHFGIKSYALADPLKDMAKALFELFEKTVSEDKKNMRKYYQQIGTEICRKTFGEDIWCKALEERMDKTDTLAIISDIRFKNEYEYFKKRYETIFVRVYNPSFREEDVMKHSSETYINEFVPDIIYNWKQMNDDYIFTLIEEKLSI